MFQGATALWAEGCGIAMGPQSGPGSKGSEGSEGRKKVLKFDRPSAGGFLGLTGLWPEGCG